MRVLIADFGQHVFEACRHMSQNGHEIIFAVNSSLQALIVNSFFRHISKAVVINSKVGLSRINELKKIYDEESCDVFYPFGYYLVTDYFISIAKDPTLKMHSPYGSEEVYWDISDKSNLYKTLEGTDIYLPENYGCIHKNDNLNIDKFPVIVKRTRGKGINGNLILAWNRAEISDFLAQASDDDEFIVQQYIPGDIYDVGGFAINGDLFYAVPQRRTVTLPLRGGVAAVNDIWDDSNLVEKARIIMERSGWTGPFQAEFRQDPTTKKYYLIEVNAKMWGSSPLSLKSNPDLLKIALDVSSNKYSPKSLGYRKNLRYRWILGQELQAVCFGNFKDFREFLVRFLTKSYYDFNIKDPAPDLAVFMFSIYRILFDRKMIPRPLIDYQKNKELNQD